MPDGRVPENNGNGENTITIKVPDIMKKIGAFEIDQVVMMHDWERLRDGLLSKLIVTRCEFIYRGNQSFWLYEACSEMFRRLRDNEAPPFYAMRWNDKSNQYDAMDAAMLNKLASGKPHSNKIM